MFLLAYNLDLDGFYEPIFHFIEMPGVRFKIIMGKVVWPESRKPGFGCKRGNNRFLLATSNPILGFSVDFGKESSLNYDKIQVNSEQCLENFLLKKLQAFP